MILKEIGGRVQNAAGTINSNKNMFYGSNNNAPSDKLAGGLLGGGGGGGLGGGIGPQMSGGAAEGANAADSADAASAIA